MNVECAKPTLDELTDAFRFSDAVLRHLVIRRDEAMTEPSFLAKSSDDDSRESGGGRGGSRESVRGEEEPAAPGDASDQAAA
jgi:small subunit ribosomal protein S6